MSHTHLEQTPAFPWEEHSCRLAQIGSRRGCNSQSAPVCRGAQIEIPGDERRCLTERERTREVDRVVATQPELIGELARSTGQVLVDPDDEQFRAGRVEVLDRLAMAHRCETTCAPCRRERRTSLRVREETRRDGVSRIPQLRDQLRAILGDDQLDQRRGVEVERQRR
jgi:hypothetical protein